MTIREPDLAAVRHRRDAQAGSRSIPEEKSRNLLSQVGNALVARPERDARRRAERRGCIVARRARVLMATERPSMRRWENAAADASQPRRRMSFHRPVPPRGNRARRTAAAVAGCCHTALVLAASPLADLVIVRLHAQSPRPQYIAKVWQTEQGLPQNSVNAILQDQKGYFWIGTFGGLARFDGERFTVSTPADTRGFGSARILHVAESRSGDLWIGTVDGGLTRLRDGVAVTYTTRDGLPSEFVGSIREDREGNLWINTARGVAHFVGPQIGGVPHASRSTGDRVSPAGAHGGAMWFRYRTWGDALRGGWKHRQHEGAGRMARPRSSRRKCLARRSRRVSARPLLPGRVQQCRSPATRAENHAQLSLTHDRGRRRATATCW